MEVITERQKFLSVKALCERWNVSRSTLYRGEKNGRFPARVRITERRVGYLLADVLRCEEQWPMRADGR